MFSASDEIVTKDKVPVNSEVLPLREIIPKRMVPVDAVASKRCTISTGTSPPPQDISTQVCEK